MGGVDLIITIATNNEKSSRFLSKGPLRLTL